MAWQDLTDQEQQIIGSWLGTLRDWGGKMAELTDLMLALQNRYDSGVGTILEKIELTDEIDDGQWMLGKDVMTRNDALVLYGYMTEVVTLNDDAAKRRAYEGSSGRIVQGGNFRVSDRRSRAVRDASRQT